MSLMMTLSHTIWQGFWDGTRRYGVPGNENDESIVCMSVLYQYDKQIMAYRTFSREALRMYKICAKIARIGQREIVLW